ncbi:MAG TPA: peptidoglycan-binding domain-containing protein [Bryobacteraceae bacterium]|nr:peptidoglycan-binding domain-containing protein [Bryobacteraceae bacterium]
MNRALAVALLGIALLPLNAVPPAHAQSVKASQTKQSKSSPAKPGAARHKVAARSSRRAAPRPSYQLHPDPERYQQIQQALAERGYFKGQVNGQWGDDSMDALKRFQADQKLEDDGKISALTLTGLGLGPKHAGGSVTGSVTGSATGSVTPVMPPSSDSAATPHAGSAESSAPPPAASSSQSVPPPATATPPR